MGLITQISGNNHTKIRSLKDLLRGQEVSVVEPTAPDEPNLLTARAWEDYERELAVYESISATSFHTICNENGNLSKRMALQAAYAMLNSKPVMLQELPTFTDDVDTFLQRIITSRLHHLFVCNLTVRSCTPQEVKSAMRHLSSTNHIDYALNIHDEILIRSKVRNYLRDIVRTLPTSEVQERRQSVAKSAGLNIAPLLTIA